MVPWADAASGLHFVDLRAEPYDIAEIAEAEKFPPLGRALRSLNATRSAFLTSKCDAWPLEGEELDALVLELDGLISEDHPRAAFGCYIDLIPRERALFLSAHRQQSLLDRFIRRAERLLQPDAKLLCTLRPAMFEHGGTVQEGYAITLYVLALGTDAATALRTWELALEEIVAQLRGREFELYRGSATIDGA